MKKTWMVRAGRDAMFIDEFREKGRVSIGWSALGSLAGYQTRDDLARGVAQHWPEWHKQAQAMAPGQVWRFKSEIQSGDTVVTYDPSLRSYLVGEVVGSYTFDPSSADQPNVLPVNWKGEAGRDLLSATTKNSLGAISTIFLVPPDAAVDLARALASQKPAEVPEVAAAEEEQIAEDMHAKAIEFVKDRAATPAASQRTRATKPIGPAFRCR